MSELQSLPLTDTWVVATWNEYIQAIANPTYEKAKSYYYNGRMRIQMSPIGYVHAKDHSILNFAICLFGCLKGIPLNALDNCTYRKAGVGEVQPDLSYYIGENVDAIPYGTSIINLDIYPVPDLVIEVANTSLADDRGEKRLLYEDLKVKEYWVLDVQNVKILAFEIIKGGSRRISVSQVLPGLKLSIIEEALQRTRQTNQSEVCAWLLTQFQQ